MRLVRIIVTVTALTLALSGCVGEARGAPRPTATPTSTWASPFANNDEALAAAVDAFQRYVDVSNQVSSSPTADLSSIDEVATGAAASQEKADVESQRARGIVRSGPVRFDSPSFDYGSIDELGLAHVAGFVCLDLTEARLLNGDGSDVTPADRDDRFEWQVHFVATEPGENTLVLERSVQWNSDGRC